MSVKMKLLFIVLGFLVVIRRIIASYFCNLAFPTSGGLGNQVACSVVNQGTWGNVVTVLGLLMFMVGIGFVIRDGVIRRVRRVHT